MEKLDKLTVIKNTLLALLLGSAFFACVSDIGTTLKTDQAQRLLTGDTVKFWVRVSRTEDGSDVDVSSCEESAAIVMTYNSNVADTLFYYKEFPKEGFSDNSGGSDPYFKAVYELSGDVDDNFTDMINLSDIDPEDFSISNIEVIDMTTDYLRIRYSQSSDEEESSSEIEEIFYGSVEYQSYTLN